MSSEEQRAVDPERRREQRRIIRRITVTLLAVLFAGVLVGGIYLGITFDRAPVNHPEDEVVVEVGAGEGASAVGKMLDRAGLVRNARYFRIRHEAETRMDRLRAIQSGRFTIPPGSTTTAILAILTNPDKRLLEKVTVKEGWTVSRIAEALEEAGITTREDFIAVAKTPGPGWQDRFPLPGPANSLEGYLFPETYMIEAPLDLGDPSATRSKAREMAELMLTQFFEVLDEVDPTWEDLTPVQLHEKVILASIVQKEYRWDDEAPKIARVFLNRIEHPRTGLQRELQSCATVVYVITETPEGAAYREQYEKNRRILDRYLEIPSPYNTYQKRQYGLPPGPIANPGRVALDAAFFPYDGEESRDMLFFVLKPDGSFRHEFRATLEDHNAAKRRYLATFGT